ncbi:MAG: hypothetical protein GEU98_03435 [Pseudonocardiaceae bacterium]|nr:hypothetical protein [Pseudonocardiaceae bacterium]
MKLLVDANLSPRVTAQLAARYEAMHVGEVGMLTATDEKILAYAVANDCVIVSADSDFATMLALTGAHVPSLVLLRSADRLTPDEQSSLLMANLPAVHDELVAGAVVSLSTEHLRVRRLPI